MDMLPIKIVLNLSVSCIQLTLKIYNEIFLLSLNSREALLLFEQLYPQGLMLTLQRLPECVTTLKLLIFKKLLLEELLFFLFVGALILLSRIICQKVELLLILNFE